MVLLHAIENLRQKKILLGSGSPRRKQLLYELGLNFRVLVKETDEVPDSGLKGASIAENIAFKKATILLPELHNDEILITADTIVCLNEEVLGKPADEKEAIAMIEKLNGKKHTVYTGVFVASSKKQILFHDKTDVYFNQLSDQLIHDYINTYRPLDKAGSYGAQEGLPEGVNLCSKEEMDYLKNINQESLFYRTLAVDSTKHIPLIDHIEGSYFNVMGLPVVKLLQTLTEHFL